MSPEVDDKSPDQPIRKFCYFVVKSHPYLVMKILLFVAFIVSMSLFTSEMGDTYFNVLIMVKFSFVGL